MSGHLNTITIQQSVISPLNPPVTHVSSLAFFCPSSRRRDKVKGSLVLSVRVKLVVGISWLIRVRMPFKKALVSGRCQLQDTTDALPCHIHVPVCLWIMDPHSRAPRKNTSHGNEVLPQDRTHLIQRPCYQRGSPCKDPAGKRTTPRPPDYREETQTTVVWSCLPFIRSGPNHLARHSERGKKTRQTYEEVGRQHQGMDRPGVRQFPDGCGEQGKVEKTSCKIICGAPTTLAVKGLIINDMHYRPPWKKVRIIKPDRQM